MKLVIAKKPLQGVAFSKVLGANKRGKGYIVKWNTSSIVNAIKA